MKSLMRKQSEIKPKSAWDQSKKKYLRLYLIHLWKFSVQQVKTIDMHGEKMSVISVYQYIPKV